MEISDFDVEANSHIKDLLNLLEFQMLWKSLDSAH